MKTEQEKKALTYKVGNQSYTPSQLSNNMSGTDANAIYYASHGGTGNAPLTNNKSGNLTYNVGNQKFTQSQLNNNMSGTDANAIYYATHGGTGNKSLTSGNVTVTPASSGGNTTRRTTNNATTEDYSYPDYSYDGYDYDYGYSNGGDTGIDFQAYLDALIAEQNRLQEEALAEQRRREEEQRAAAQAAYDASKGRLDSAWGDTLNALQGNLDSTLGQLKRNYEYGADVARDDAAESLREAYINHMMNKRNIGQNLAAMGINGGATESTLANLYNQYGNSRNGINKTTADNIRALLEAYNNNTASANQLYNSQYADARNNYANQLNGLEQALANNIMASYNGGANLVNTSGYQQALQNLTNQMSQLASKAAQTPTQNTLSVNKVTTRNNNATNNANTNYARYLQMAKDLYNTKNVSGLDLAKYLVANGADQNTLYQIYGVA